MLAPRQAGRCVGDASVDARRDGDARRSGRSRPRRRGGYACGSWLHRTGYWRSLGPTGPHERACGGLVRIRAVLGGQTNGGCVRLARCREGHRLGGHLRIDVVEPLHRGLSCAGSRRGDDSRDGLGVEEVADSDAGQVQLRGKYGLRRSGEMQSRCRRKASPIPWAAEVQLTGIQLALDITDRSHMRHGRMPAARGHERERALHLAVRRTAPCAVTRRACGIRARPER
jgi:hypothetical protein